VANAKTEKELHRIFDATLLLKGIHATVELIGGLLLYIASADSITRVVDFFVKGEINEDPHDVIANYILMLGHSLGGSSKAFAALYLASHGVVNGLVTLGLWKEKMWAYPISLAVIMGFIAYQLYLLAFGYSLWLVVLTVLDVAILLLAWHEYRLLKMRKALTL
jgi:uncharacterized membrane protein